MKYWRLLALALLPLSSTALAEGLASAIAETYRNNPTLEAQREELRGYDESYIQAGSPYRLQLSVTATAELDNDRVLNIFGDRVSQHTSLSTAGLTASQIIFAGGRAAAQLSAAEADRLSSRERLRDVENQVILQVVEAYAAVLRDQQIVQIRQQALDSFNGQVKQADARKSGGELTKTDVAQAQAQAAIARVSLSEALVNVETSRAQFAVLVGHSPGMLDPLPDLPGLPVDIGGAYQAAEKSSPVLWQAILNERAGNARVAAARAEANPTITASGSAGVASSPISEGYHRNLSGVVTFSLPLLSGDLIESRRRQAIDEDQRQLDLVDEARRSVQLTILQSWNQAAGATAQLSYGQAAVSAAETSSYGSAREFKEGFRSTFEVLNEEQRLLDARVVVAQADYAKFTGQASLLAALGDLTAVALVSNVSAYDGFTKADRRAHGIYGPLDPLLFPLDRAFEPSGKSHPVVPPPVTPDPKMRPAQTQMPLDAPLATPLSPGKCSDGASC